MAYTKISDVIIKTVYADTQTVDNPERNAFIASGVLETGGMIDAIANGPVRVGNIDYWGDLNPTDEPNYSNDNPADIAVPKNIVMGEMRFRKAFLNQGWSNADLVKDLLKDNPIQRVKNRVDVYWRRQLERRAIASLQGILADNVANDDGDMVNDVSGTLNSDIDAGTLFSAEALTAAAFTMGEDRENLAAIAVHPIVMMRMINENRIDYIQDSVTGLMLPTYAGLVVIESENLPYTAAEGANPEDDAAKYTSILFGRSSIAFGQGVPSVPMEIEREAAQGTGGGVETLWSRKEWIVHPLGFDFTSTTLTGTTGQNPIVSADLGDLRLAVNWDRKYDRKQVPFAFLITNG